MAMRALSHVENQLSNGPTQGEHHCQHAPCLHRMKSNLLNHQWSTDLYYLTWRNY
jgi:hypothetical protein